MFLLYHNFLIFQEKRRKKELFLETTLVEENMVKTIENQLSGPMWKNMFNQAFDSSIIGMAIVSRDGFFIKTNEALREMLGYTEQEMIFKHWMDITHPEDIKKSTLYVKEYEGKPSSFHMILKKRYITKEGKTIHCRITTSVVSDKDNPSLFITQIENITALHNLKKTIEENRGFCQNILARTKASVEEVCTAHA